MLVLSACAGDDQQPATMALQPDELAATSPPPEPQPITFIWSGGKGDPDVIIHQTSSTTSQVTTEFIARDIIARHRRSPPRQSRLTAPLKTDRVIENATHLSRPIILPKPYDPRITIGPADRNRDDSPTVLPVAPM